MGIKNLNIAPLPLASANVKEAVKDGVRKVLVEASDFTPNENNALECRLQLPILSADNIVVTFSEDVLGLLETQMLGVSVEAAVEDAEAYGDAVVTFDVSDINIVTNGINLQAGQDTAILGGKADTYSIKFERFGSKMESSGFYGKIYLAPQEAIPYVPQQGEEEEDPK